MTTEHDHAGVPASHPITVLLIDDQMMIGEVVKRMLAGENDIRFHFCLNPSEAMRIAREIAPTTILQDLVMPDIDGLTMVKSFRAEPATRDIPLIVLSSEEDAKVKADAFALGANDYLIKLPDRVELVARIRYHSRGYINMLERNEAENQNRLIQVRLQQSQKLASIGKLAAGIAHEINTPLQFIRDNLSFLDQSFTTLNQVLEKTALLAGAPPVDPDELVAALRGLDAVIDEADLEFLREETAGAIEQSLDGTAKIATIVAAMKEFSSSSGGKMALNNLNHMIENAVAVTTHQWQAVADMRLELAPGPLEAVCCSEEVNQSLLNLIVNAAQAIEAVAVAQNRRGHITITSASENGRAVITVADDGQGIPATIRDRVYEPFFTTREVGKGSGQGLTIAFDIIVNRHKGELTFLSEEGRGTVFTLKLPLGSQPATK